MIVRDNHAVIGINDIEFHDPGDHDDGIEKAIMKQFTDEVFDALLHAPMQPYDDKPIKLIQNAINAVATPERLLEIERDLAAHPEKLQAFVDDFEGYLERFMVHNADPDDLFANSVPVEDE